MDKPNHQRRSKIDLLLDPARGIAIYRGDTPFQIRGLEAEMLHCLVKNDPNPTFLKELHAAVGPQNWQNVRKRLTAKLEKKDLTLEYVRGESVRLVERTQKLTHSTEDAAYGDTVTDRRPLYTTSTALGAKHGFAISIDGIILNSASELIFGCVDRSRVQECRLLYRSSIEDLAFALVYGSRLSSKWLPRDEVAHDLGVGASTLVQEPAELLISQFGADLYGVDKEDARFRYGRVLENEHARRGISQYIVSLGKALEMPFVKEICREWLVREADTYLGEDRSLFTSLKKDEPLHFGKKYYSSDFLDEVPGLIGHSALNILISFLPKAFRGKDKQKPYTPFARQQFVLQNILTHLTIMYEYEKSSEAQNVHRLPFILRGVVKERWYKEYEKESQLRTLLVRSALYEGLHEAEDAYGREQLVKRLLWIREEAEFAQMRNRLEELGVMVKEQRSKGIESLLDEIRNNKQQRHDVTVRVGLTRNTVMPLVMIRRVDAGVYIERLYKYFPELNVTR